MQWGNPSLLHALWGLIPLALLLWGLARRRERALQQMIDAQVLPSMLPPHRWRVQRWRRGLWIAALALGIVALARPQWGEKWIEVQHMGLDIVVVLDTSNSMRAEDIRPNRLERAKLGLRDLVRHLRGDRIALVPFAGDSYLYCPLTSDYSAFLMMLDDVYPGIVPRGGTAIEQALRRAIQSFDDDLLADRVILLISDGEDHEGNPLTLVDEMRRRNIRLFAVGVGTPEGELIPITDERGRTTFLRDRQGTIVRTRLEEDTLERLATRTGGMYVRATPGDFGLDYLYEQGIAPLQRDQLTTEQIRVYEDRFIWFLWAALLLLAIEAGIHAGTGWVSSRRRTVTALVLAGFMIGLESAMAADPRQFLRDGIRAYEAEDFATAVERFREAIDEAEAQGTDPSRAWFNLGTAKSRLGAWDAAIEAYKNALQSTDEAVQQSTFMNKGYSLVNQALEQAEQGDMPSALQQAEQALQSYRNAIVLDPADREAKINHERTQRLVEELREMQPPPQEQPDQQPDDSPDEGEDEQEQPQPDTPQPDAADEPEPGDDEADEDPTPDDLQPDAAPDDPAMDATMPEPTMDEMTEEEAMLLLDALRDEEQETRDQMRLQLGEPAEVEKDW